MKIKFLFAWYDMWVGFFWDSKKKWLYFFPVPMFGVIFQFGVKQKGRKWNWGAFIFIFTICALGACSNKNVNSLYEWSCLMLFFGVPFSLLFAFLGREEKK